MRNLSSQSSSDRNWAATIDWKLIFCYLALVIIGCINIYASIQSTEPSSIFDLSSRSGKQIVWIGVSIIAGILVLFAINPKIWEMASPFAYLAVLGLLVLVIFVSKDVKGSHSWFELGPIKFQPAEISKITTSLMLALVMSKQGFKLTVGRNFLAVAAVLLMPMLAILGEAETGTALVYCGFIFVLYREGLSGWWLVLILSLILLFVLTLSTNRLIAGIVLASVTLISAIIIVSGKLKRNIYKKVRRYRLRVLLFGFLAGVVVIIASDYLFNNVLQEHQRKRIEVLLGLKEDPTGVGYNVRQSMIAIGSGGLSGKGYLNGTQTTYGFVPEQSTDFIFCTVGEEWGFLGCLIVILIYSFMLIRIIINAEESREPFIRIYGYCLASCLFAHLFINIGMTVGLMPVIGIPLPLLSYGGSSMIAFSFMIFIFLALRRQEKKYF